MLPNIKNILINNKSCMLLYEHHVVDGGTLSESRGMGFVSATASTLTSYAAGSAIPQCNALVTASALYWRNYELRAEAILSIVGNNTIRINSSTSRVAWYNKPKKMIKITGSTSNNGYYTVVSASQAGSPLRTQIIVEETTLVNSGTMGTVSWDDPLAFGTGDFTLETVAYPVYNSTYAYRSVVGNYYSQGICLELDYGATTWNLTFYTAGTLSTAAVALPYSAWYHFLVVRKSGTLKIWVNGTLVYTGANVVNVTTASGNTFAMGADASSATAVSSTFYFNGQIARVGVWKGAQYWHNGTTTGKKHFDTSLVLRIKGQKINMT